MQVLRLLGIQNASFFSNNISSITLGVIVVSILYFMINLENIIKRIDGYKKFGNTGIANIWVDPRENIQVRRNLLNNSKSLDIVFVRYPSHEPHIAHFPNFIH